jgi:hypothetical protein
MRVVGLVAYRGGRGPAVGLAPHFTPTLLQEGPADAACAALSVAGLSLWLLGGLR